MRTITMWQPILYINTLNLTIMGMPRSERMWLVEESFPPGITIKGWYKTEIVYDEIL